ncbi:hypothetical protein [Pseudonocardia asaccharolytica]|uniref:Uncharacterized protein n=1 Tax=Pseudonocardia asaccharolytica DSM 44247 = NBRC 16224 TaxID=1123024 RepID=A0A511D7V7_9PSEU|nr:hypothetical protein [Pseudonocardia asaccharolytica]GEL20891.1 hypothetical protein PA7_47280 [Pseudonocardia asaccharolytica DSM 44247 = NBRC 16224]
MTVIGFGTGGEDTRRTLLRAAAALKWTRPELTAALGEYVVQLAEAAGDESSWAEGAAWLLHGRAAIGDARQDAVGLLERLDRLPGCDAAALLADPAAMRLRVELAAVAHDCGDSSLAHTLRRPLADDPGAAADIHFDALVNDARAALAGRPDQLDDLLRSVEDAAGELPDTPASAVAALLRTAADRAHGRNGAAAERAEAMLGRLGWTSDPGGKPAGGDHLAAAFATQWIGALLDAGCGTQARRAAESIEFRLEEQTTASRQIAQLRLMWVRATTGGNRSTVTTAALSRAAQEAADAGVPALEAACRTALAEVHEAAGQLDVAVASMRLGVVAERQDQERTARFRALAGRLADAGRRTQRPAAEDRDAAATTAKPTPHPRTTTEPTRTAVALAVPGDGRHGAASSWQPAVDSRTDGAPAPEPAIGPSESPLGDALLSELRSSGSLAEGRWPLAEADHTAGPPSPSTDADAWDGGTAEGPPADPARAAGDWLTGAIAEIDRVWGVPMASSAEPAAEPDPPEPGLVVVLELVAGDTRVTGRAARAAMRRVGRRLGGDLPPGARVRDEGPDAVGVVLPASSRASADGWLRSVLGDLVDGLPAADELEGVVLRATTAGAADAPGVEILQKLGPSHAGEETAGADPAPTFESRGTRHATDGRPPFRPGNLDIAPGSGGRRHRRASAEATTALPAITVATKTDRPHSGTHADTDRGAATTPDADTQHDAAPPDPEPDLANLGLADLLAGALAAYRGM